MDEISLQNIFIYPIKSLGAVELSECELDERGLKYDRRFMLVDEHSRYITQREFPRLSLIRTAIRNSQIEIENQHSEKLFVPLELSGNDLRKATIWNHECNVLNAGREADDFFSDAISSKCSLVYMPSASQRRVNPAYVSQYTITAFTDGYPILLMGTASLEDLNSRMEKPIGMERFRPALVAKTTRPSDEDYWADFKIGELNFHGVKLCSRCVITTVDQKTGTTGKEPLKTLATYRKRDHHIYFGQNVVHENKTGTLRVGNKITVVRRAEPVV